MTSSLLPSPAIQSHYDGNTGEHVYKALLIHCADLRLSKTITPEESAKLNRTVLRQAYGPIQRELNRIGQIVKGDPTEAFRSLERLHNEILELIKP